MYTVTFKQYFGGSTFHIMHLEVEAASKFEAEQIFHDVMEQNNFYYEIVAIKESVPFSG